MESSGETSLFPHLCIFIAAIGTQFLFCLPRAVPILPCEDYRHQNNASFCLLLCYCCHSHLPVSTQEMIAVPCPCPCGVSQLFGELFLLSCGRQYNPSGFYIITYNNNALIANLGFSERLFAERKEFLALGTQIKFVVMI